MTLKLVSVEEAKARLRIDASAGDADLDLMIQGASAEILNYLRPTDLPWTDTYGDPIEDTDGLAAEVPPDVKNACLLYVGILSKNRDSKSDVEWEHGFLPRPVLSMLYAYRTPTIV